MRELQAALWAEALKARRSQVLWMTAIAIALAPLVGGMFMWILMHPTLARRFGILAAKAQLSAASGNWPTYLGLLAQATAIGGLVVFGFVAIWVFGREYSNRTIKDLLAVPVARAQIVIAKMLVIAAWTLLLTLLLVVLGLAIGASIGLPGWSFALAARGVGRVALVAGLTLVVVSPLAWIASAGRGYLPAMAVMLFAIFLTQVMIVLGWGEYFPWAVPALVSGAAGPLLEDLGVGSYVLVVLAGGVGLAGTIRWWQSADQV